MTTSDAGQIKNAAAQPDYQPGRLLGASIADLMALSGMNIRESHPDATPEPTANQTKPVAPAQTQAPAKPAPATPHRLVELASSKDMNVRIAVASRPDCPMGLLATLVYDRKAEVRMAVASNPNLVTAVAEQLATDKDRQVLMALVANPHVDVAVLKQLTQHRKDEIRLMAAATLEERANKPSDWSDDAAALPAELRDRAGGAGV